MLCDVLLVILALYLMASPFFYAKAIKFGMKLTNDPEEALPELQFNVPKMKKKPKMTPEEDRTYQILRNIDIYDGTSAGQKEVQVDGHK